MVGWSDTDNAANLSPASLRYAANGVVAELGKIIAVHSPPSPHPVHSLCRAELSV